eukprot:gene4643-5801_t
MTSTTNNLLGNRYKASMILGAVGDSLGYKNARWEFERCGKQILKEYKALGGVKSIVINPRNWRISDDTIMHIATAIAITLPNLTTFNSICEEIALAYIRSMEDMNGRAPGRQSMISVSFLNNDPKKWNQIPYSPSGGGCGGSMRSMCIGLKYWNPENLDTLISLSIESGRITHNHPTGFLGAMVSSLFTSYAIQGIEPKEWGRLLVDEVMPKAKEYMINSEQEPNRTWAVYEKGYNYFLNAWQSYLNDRKIPFGENKNATDEYPVFPEPYGPEEREKFYEAVSFDGWGGSSGHDSVIIAYDALLGAGDSWEEMVERGIIHGGDSDSTGSIGCAWWGAFYGFEGVPMENYQQLEYKPIIEGLAKKLYEQRSNDKTSSTEQNRKQQKTE